jgi:hypothetical protein
VVCLLYKGHTTPYRIEAYIAVKTIDFTDYQNMNLVLEIAALESAVTFCGFVEGPWLLVRRDSSQRKQATALSVLVECEYCRSTIVMPVPIPSLCLCSDCIDLEIAAYLKCKGGAI